MAAAVLGGRSSGMPPGESLVDRAEEEDDDSLLRCKPANTSKKSPRCEAFVMTGDKILNLNPNISPSYAKVARDQLPPRTKIQEVTVSQVSQIPTFPSSRRGRLQSSMSQPEGVTLPKPPLSTTVQRVLEELAEEKEQHGAEKEGKRESDLAPCSIPPGMMSSVHSKAYSNPHLNERTMSSETFTVSVDSPSKMSTATVNGTARGALKEPSSGEAARGSGMRESTGGLPPPFPSSSASNSTHMLRTHSTADSFYVGGSMRAALASWGGMRIDAALRDFLSQVELRGETSQRERIIRHFSSRYQKANPTIFSTLDEVHALSCGLLLLNSDLHGTDSKKKMTCREFIVNMSHTGYEYQRALLKNLYSSIKEAQLVYEGVRADKEAKKKKSSQSRLPFLEDPQSQVEYHRGFLMRKIVYDTDGSPTPLGRRGWRMQFVRLRGLALYFSSSESEPCLYSALSHAVLLHHALAEAAPEYTKRKHVFRIRTAALGEILFQTTSEREVQEWVTTVNTVTACFSSRALPPAVDSSGRILWPRLPRFPSSASLHQQLTSHQNAASSLQSELERLRKSAPPLKAKGKPVEEFFFNERLLMQEISRYKVYCGILSAKLDMMESDSGILSKASMGNNEDADRISYREAMQFN